MGVARKRSVSSTGVVTYSNPITIVDHSLGNTGKSVDQGYQERRSQRYRLLGVAARLLPKYAVGSCMRRCGAGGVQVRYSPSSGVAGYQGLATCKSVWVCPVCSAKISNGRRDELNTMLQWARRMGYKPMLLTLTTRHAIDHSLHDSLTAIKAAKRRFHQSKAWRSIDAHLIGHVTATEVTHGASGWHPHFHMILIVADGVDAQALLESGRRAWERALEKSGMDCNERGYQVQGADQAGDYVSKWGAGEEMTLTGSKVSRPGAGRNPWQLLAAADVGDDRAGALFVEYAKEFHGKRQLVWSKGFKRLLGIVEKSDEELADTEPVEDMQDVCIVSSVDWHLVVSRRLQAELLCVAEEGAQVGKAALYIDCWLDALRLQHKLDFFQ